MKIKLFLSSTLISLIAVLSCASTAYAWHPQGYIQKQVQNQTSQSAIVDANDAAAALTVKTGDILVYTFTVGNKGAVDSRNYNDMASTVLTDKLPTGVELVSDPAQRTVTMDLGTIKPQASVTKTITVKVTANKDATVIDNEACFTGNSTANDNAQSGCDKAVVKVSVPKKPEDPVTPVKPVTPPTVQGTTVVTTLPATGQGNIITSTLAVIVLGYLASRFSYNLRARKSL